VTLHEWLDLLEKQAEVRPGITDRILTNAKQMLKWGVKRRLIPANPLAEISARQDLQIKKQSEFRSLSDDEIARVWRAIEYSRMATKNRVFLKLCLLYGCRNGELRQSQKAHFDFDKKAWTIPPENHKLGKSTGKPLVRPIIPEAETLLREAFALAGRGSHLFTNNGSDEPMGTSAPLALPYNVMQWLRRHEKYEMEHWSVHDLRKTARTNFSTLTDPHVAEIMLGHRLPGSWQDLLTPPREELPRHEVWRRQYRARPYLRHLSDEEALRHGGDIMRRLMPHFLKDGPGYVPGLVNALLEEFTHFQDEATFRALDLRKMPKP
jgi:integrase